MFKMFKACVPKKPIASPQGWFYHGGKITVLRIRHSILFHGYKENMGKTNECKKNMSYVVATENNSFV